jgi:hypothetical protein
MRESGNQRRAREVIARVLQSYPEPLPPRTARELKALLCTVWKAEPHQRRDMRFYNVWLYVVRITVRDRFTPDAYGAEIIVPCKTCHAERYKPCNLNDRIPIDRDLLAALEVAGDAEAEGNYAVLPALRTLTFHARRRDLYRGRYQHDTAQQPLFAIPHEGT